jgi:hypothetical protein
MENLWKLWIWWKWTRESHWKSRIKCGLMGKSTN